MAVEVPVRVVVDPAAARTPEPGVAEAVAAAVARAVGNALAVVDDTRGGYVGHRLGRPTVRLTGDALARLTPAEQASLESSVAEAVRRAAADTLARAAAPADAARAGTAAPLSPPAVEPADPDRHAPLAGTYVLPSYQTGDDPDTADVTGAADASGRPPAPAGPGGRGSGAGVAVAVPVDGDAETQAAPQWRAAWLSVADGDLLAAVEDEIAIQLSARASTPAQVGVVYRRQDGVTGVYARRHPSREMLADLAFDRLHLVRPHVVDGRIEVREEEATVGPTDRVHLRFLGPGRTLDDRVAVYRAVHAGPYRRAVLADLAARQRTAALPAEERERRADERVAEAARAWARDRPAVAYLELQVGADRFAIPAPEGYTPPSDLDVECYPLYTYVPGAPDRVGAGDGGGAPGRSEGGDPGRGQGRGPGAQLPALPLPGGEDGSQWPRTGDTAGDPLACEPYLAEPAADTLTDDHGLVAAMQRIAADLEVGFDGHPEGAGCGFLGRFALSAARLAAVRARGIGLASVRLTTQTQVTVRQDGGGNNGFLDVRPGASPEFGYLQRLGRLVHEIHELGTGVVSAYLDPANRDLVRTRPDGEPDAAGWGLRFLGEFPDAVRAAYLHVYAETCRVLLLQQLRSSRSGITGRQSHLDATLTSFTQTLDILGETVVQLTTLRQAIRHSRTVSVTGTVRHVLSVPETTYNPKTDDYIESSPPGRSVPATILAAVGDARIERRGSERVAVHAGRTWRLADLDAAVALRRSLLNRVDPLFLQVSSLDALYARHQRDPGYAREYLTGLLAQMLSANEEMTRRAGEADDGAFFALEASQYVRRQGGRDHRGLEYQLQGIHALADQQLRDHVGGDPLYADGVNGALGVKAGFDALLMVFSTAGIIVLGLLCAPLGAVAVAVVTGVAGLALTAHDLAEAGRQHDLYRALEDPELFQRWQDVQLAQLLASLSVAFSVFDVVGVGRAAHVVVGGARHGLRVAARGGARMGAASVARATRRQVLQSMTREVLENAVRQAVAASTVVAVLTTLLPVVLQPVLVPWLRAQAVEHGTLAEVDAALGALAVGQPPPPTREGAR